VEQSVLEGRDSSAGTGVVAVEAVAVAAAMLAVEGCLVCRDTIDRLVGVREDLIPCAYLLCDTIKVHVCHKLAVDGLWE
jgi:hypothetical protein